MKKIITSVLLLASFSLTANAATRSSSAASEQALNELEGATNAQLTFGSGRDTNWSMAVGYHRLLTDIFQVGVVGGWSTGGSISSLRLQVGPTINFAMDNSGIRNAVFLRLLAGISRVSSSISIPGFGTVSDSTTNFAYGASIGKRFGMFPGWTWNPSFDITGTTATGDNPEFALAPFSVSVEF